MSDADCADDDREKLCNYTTTLCVECRTDDDCPASKPYCDDGDCGQCAEDSDCPGEQKCNDGQCEPD
jgi:Cys-rich repeat protein